MQCLSFKLQKKMATCYDLTFNRAVSVAIAVEDKGRVHQNAKRMWKGSGTGSSQDSAKHQKVIIRTTGSTNIPYRSATYPVKTPIFIRPTNMQHQSLPANNQAPRLPAPTGTKYPCYNCGKQGISLKTAPTPTKTTQISRNQQEIILKIRTRILLAIVQKEGTTENSGEYSILKWM